MPLRMAQLIINRTLLYKNEYPLNLFKCKQFNIENGKIPAFDNVFILLVT